jgi:G:T-mismatch repair DNA endonuclease (very short patch repair protein)
MDTVCKKTRSIIMASVGKSDAGPEIFLQKALLVSDLDITCTKKNCPYYFSITRHLKAAENG